MHKHHVVPKHAGGSDDPSNIVFLTVEEHAEAHRMLWEQYGRQQDFLAWKGLEGRLPKEEIVRMIVSFTNKGNKYWVGKKHSEEALKKMRQPKSATATENNRLSHLGQVPWNKGLTKETDPRVAKNAASTSASLMRYHPGRGKKVGPPSEQSRKKMSEARKKNPSPRDVTTGRFAKK